MNQRVLPERLEALQTAVSTDDAEMAARVADEARCSVEGEKWNLRTGANLEEASKLQVPEKQVHWWFWRPSIIS